MIDAVFGALGVSQPDAEPLGKSEFWVLQLADGALISAERHDPSRLGAVAPAAPSSVALVLPPWGQVCRRAVSVDRDRSRLTNSSGKGDGRWPTTGARRRE